MTNNCFLYEKRMVPQSKTDKILRFKKHLQKYLHLPFFKNTSGTRTQETSQIQDISFTTELNI
jgi:hypothetical protein